MGGLRRAYALGDPFQATAIRLTAEPVGQPARNLGLNIGTNDPKMRSEDLIKDGLICEIIENARAAILEVEDPLC